jgi:hypothetical protein
MYAAGYGIRPMKSTRRDGFRLALIVRDLVVLVAVAAVSGGLANSLVR